MCCVRQLLGRLQWQKSVDKRIDRCIDWDRITENNGHLAAPANNGVMVSRIMMKCFRVHVEIAVTNHYVCLLCREHGQSEDSCVRLTQTASYGTTLYAAVSGGNLAAGSQQIRSVLANSCAVVAAVWNSTLAALWNTSEPNCGSNSDLWSLHQFHSLVCRYFNPWIDVGTDLNHYPWMNVNFTENNNIADYCANANDDIYGKCWINS